MSPRGGLPGDEIELVGTTIQAHRQRPPDEPEHDFLLDELFEREGLAFAQSGRFADALASQQHWLANEIERLAREPDKLRTQIDVAMAHLLLAETLRRTERFDEAIDRLNGILPYAHGPHAASTISRSLKPTSPLASRSSGQSPSHGPQAVRMARMSPKPTSPEPSRSAGHVTTSPQ